jgi:hypothetical protein
MRDTGIRMKGVSSIPLSRLGASIGLAALVALALGAAASPAAATTFDVNRKADVPDAATGDGKCDSNAGKPGKQCTLRAAIEEANFAGSRDRVKVPKGTYTLNSTVYPELTVASDVVVDGAGAGKVTIRQEPAGRIFSVANGSRLDLRDATVRDGVLADDGAGIYSNGTLIVRRSSVVGNQAIGSVGGGIFAAGVTRILDSRIGGAGAGDANTAVLAGGIRLSTTGGTLEIRDSVVRGNLAESGADAARGGGVWADGAVTIVDSQIRDNVARFTNPPADSAFGGGIFAAGELVVRGSLLAGNRVDGGFAEGGGIAAIGPSATVSRSTIRGNTGSADAAGGGISYNPAVSGTITISGSTLSGNSVGTVAGGLVVRDGAGVLTNVTASRNEAGNGGGDIFVLDASLAAEHLTVKAAQVPALWVFTSGGGSAPGSATLESSVIDGIGGFGCSISGGASLTSLGFNVEDGSSCNLTQASDRPDGTPGLAALADNGGPTLTHGLKAGSDAINRVAKSACPPPNRDQRGVKRPQGQRCDAGAYERKG